MKEKNKEKHNKTDVERELTVGDDKFEPSDAIKTALGELIAASETASNITLCSKSSCRSRRAQATWITRSNSLKTTE